MTYYVNEAVFDVPDDLVDKSVTMLERKLSTGGTLSLAVQRDTFDKTQTLEQLVKKHLEKASRTLRAYSLQFQRPAEFDGQNALELASRWRGDGGVIYYTRQAFVNMGPSWILFSGNSPVAAVTDCDALVEGALASLRFRR